MESRARSIRSVRRRICWRRWEESSLSGDGTMNSRICACCAVAAAAVALVTPFIAGAADPPAQRPNILFIFSDDHAYQAISAYGYRLNQTPNIDRLASQGMRFDRCLTTY